MANSDLRLEQHKKTVGLNKYDFVDIVLTGNVGNLSKILSDPDKRAAFFEALNVDFRKIEWAEEFTETNKPTTRSTSTRNFQAMADAVVCIITALKDHCFVLHDNFIEENYTTINGRRRRNGIKHNDL